MTFRSVLFVIFAFCAGAAQQLGAESKIRCMIEVANRNWEGNAPSPVIGIIENVSAHPLDIDVTPTLYLSRPGSWSEDRYWAPVDVLKDSPLAIDKLPIDSKGEAVAIRTKSIHLKFKKPGDSIHFRIDAAHLLWDRTISSVWPSKKLSEIAEPGTYDVRLVFETEHKESQSNRVTVVISSEAKQHVFSK